LSIEAESAIPQSPKTSRLSRSQRLGDRQHNIQHRPIGAPRVRAALASIRTFAYSKMNGLMQKKRLCGAAPRPESLLLLAGEESVV
jgi:hypothetical protein